jgi:hypothetical protein
MTKDQAQARIERAERHAKQDLLVTGTYGELIKGEFYGCSVGCDAWEISSKDPTLNIRDYRNLNHHQIVADHDGTAVWFELVRDTIFEGLVRNTIFEGLTSDRQSGLTSDRQSWWHIESAKALATLPEDVDWDRLSRALWIAILQSRLQSRLEGDWPIALTDAIEKIIAHLKDPADKTLSAPAAVVDAIEAYNDPHSPLLETWECYVLASVVRLAIDSPDELNEAISTLLDASMPDGEALAGIILKTIKEYAIL